MTTRQRRAFRLVMLTLAAACFALAAFEPSSPIFHREGLAAGLLVVCVLYFVEAI